MNLYLALVLAVLIGNLALEWVTELLNLSRLDPRLPDEFHGFYDEEEYARSQKYTRERTRFGLLQSSITTTATLIFILCGGFVSAHVWQIINIGMGLVSTFSVGIA